MKNIITIVLLLVSPLFYSQDISKAPALSAKTIRAYEIKSESKVNEFYNYHELLSDPKLNADMKQHTINEALKLFRDTETPVKNIVSKPNDQVTIKQLLEIGAKQKKHLDYAVSGFTPVKQQETATLQQWIVEYKLTTGNATLSIAQKFYIILEDKKFGILIWVK